MQENKEGMWKMCTHIGAHLFSVFYNSRKHKMENRGYGRYTEQRTITVSAKANLSLCLIDAKTLWSRLYLEIFGQ
jgi:hypothetical protein